MNLIRLPRRNATLALVATLLVLVAACSSGTKASGNAKTAKGQGSGGLVNEPVSVVGRLC